MPESRDRLSRAEDIPIVFTSRRSAVGGIAILVDESNVDRNLFGSPFRWGNTALTASNVPAATRGRFGTPRRGGNGRSRNLYGTPRATRENSAMGTGRRGRGRGRRVNTPLPHWYPRAPLRDVTTIVRAIERRRARLSGLEGPETESPTPQAQTAVDDTEATSSAPLEHDNSLITPIPTIRKKTGPTVSGTIPKILLDVSNKTTEGEADTLTPQKKLLNSIDTVEKVVMEELNKMRRTPRAKKEEREKRVRTLMSMR